MNRTLELTDDSLRRLRFTSIVSLVLAAAMIAFVVLSLIDGDFDLISLGLELGFATAIGLAGLWLRGVAQRRQRDDLERALLALRIYFAVHGILFIVGFAIATLVLLVFFFRHGI